MALAVAGTLAADAGEFRANFSQGKWNAADWTMVRSPRFERLGAFDQKDDHIVNSSDEAWSDEELYAKHVTEVYASMAYAKRLSGTVDVVSTMSFDHLMAPLIVIAPELGTSADGQHPEFRRHHEIVLYNEGINVWRYDWVDNRLKWTLVAFLRVPFEAKRKYELGVTVEAYKDTRRMTIACDGNVFGFSDDALPLDFWAGITGCEGRNRFYDFKVEEGLPAHDDASDGEH